MMIYHGEDPLPNDGAGGKYVVGEVRSSFGHPPCSATSAESALFATKCDEAFVFAIYAVKSQESVCQHSAFEKGLEFFRHMKWKMLALLATQVIEASQIFLYDFVEQCGFRAAPDVASVVPRKCRLPVSMGMCLPRGVLALLLHNGLVLQLQSALDHPQRGILLRDLQQGLDFVARSGHIAGR